MSPYSHPSHQTLAISVVDVSAVGHARRFAVGLAERLRMSELQRGELALIVTEIGTNLLQHAGGGTLLVRALATDLAGVEITGIDKGPGMVDLARCMQDGYSTGGSRGAGLGSIVRLADTFDIYTREGVGTVLVAGCLAAPSVAVPARRTDFGTVCVAYPGEEVVGDGWSLEEHDDRTTVLMVDGLGHGPLASDAALAAIRTFEEGAVGEPRELLERIHLALQGSRGAAGAVLTIDWSARTLRFVGVGNISGAMISDTTSRGLSSHNGILGQGQPRFQEFAYPWPDEGLLVMHSDGLSARWNLAAYPGLAVRSPSLIAGVLYRDALRKDDATVLVLRERASVSEPRSEAEP